VKFLIVYICRIRIEFGLRNFLTANQIVREIPSQPSDKETGMNTPQAFAITKLKAQKPEQAS